MDDRDSAFNWFISFIYIWFLNIFPSVALTKPFTACVHKLSVHPSQTILTVVWRKTNQKTNQGLSSVSLLNASHSPPQQVKFAQLNPNCHGGKATVQFLACTKRHHTKTYQLWGGAVSVFLRKGCSLWPCHWCLGAHCLRFTAMLSWIQLSKLYLLKRCSWKNINKKTSVKSKSSKTLS